MSARTVVALVTTAPSGDPNEAEELASRFGLTAVARAGLRLPELLALSGGAPVLILSVKRADLHGADGTVHRASPGMAVLRVVRAEQGEVDPLVRAAGLRPGDRVLDGTFGLGGDALVAAQAVGEAGHVLGVEANPIMAAFTLAGLRRLDPPARAAAARIEVQHGDHRLLLAGLPSRSFDVVLLDPMFPEAREAGPLFALLREHADHKLLRSEDLAAARRVARRGVLFKDSWPGRELYRLGLKPLPTRRTPRVVYGWAEAEKPDA